jgi:hypothetical protein
VISTVLQAQVVKGFTQASTVASYLLKLGPKRQSPEMKSTLESLALYEASVDHSSLRAVEDFGGGGTVTYSVTLTGRLDNSWADAFRQFRIDADSFIRFSLDPTTQIVSFRCRSTDRPTEIISVLLETLDNLVDLTNRVASATAYLDGNLGLSNL